MTRQSNRKKSIKKWNWLVDETLDTENEADLSSGDDSMNDPEFTLVANQGVSEGVSRYNNNNSAKHNESEVVRTLETVIDKFRNKSNSIDHQQDQVESSVIDKTPQCPPQTEKVLFDQSTKLMNFEYINSLPNLDLASPASKSQVVRLQSNLSNVSEIRDFATEEIDEGEVPVNDLADKTRHCAQTLKHVEINGGARADNMSDVHQGDKGSISNETDQAIRDNLILGDVNARNDNGSTKKRKLSDSACTSLGSNKIGVEHLGKSTISNIKNRASVVFPPETIRGKEKWESKLNGSDRIVPMKKGPRMRKFLTPRVPISPSPRCTSQSSLPAPRIANVMSGGQCRRPKALNSSSIFSKNNLSRMKHPNLSRLEDLGILTVSQKSEDYNIKSLDLSIPSGISVTRVKENKLSLGDLAFVLRDLSDNHGQRSTVQLEVTDAQARGLKALGIVEDSIIVL